MRLFTPASAGGGASTVPVLTGAAFVNSTYSATAIAPHAATIRWTYTIPALKRAYAMALLTSLLDRVEPTTIGTGNARIVCTPSGGILQYLIYVAGRIQNLTVDMGEVTSAAQSVPFPYDAGGVFSGITEDLATGGTRDYEVRGQFLEFNA